ncbi:hypothetical protein AAF712_013707 [Marasmius tenuissimus]|uniref:Uncharacterized protein n=1 Tax=Marasmius tenuissimus TaxID=585030 RepID=A0ABR2ZGH0_9AGAR
MTSALGMPTQNSAFTSLEDMDSATTSLGKTLRKFKNTACSAYDTKELPKETAAHGRCKAALTKKQDEEGKPKRKCSSGSAAVKRKIFNLNTYKLHALSHYIPFLRLVSTMDNYSTQIGELEHRRVKRFYTRTNKAKFVKQVANHKQGEQIIRHIETRVMKGKRDFLPKLKNHLLSIILNRRDDRFSSEECAKVKIVNDCIYRYKVFDIQYTSYDMRRCQDSVNLGNHPDIMVLANKTNPEAHPYWYAQTLGIFHARVYYEGDQALRDITFLWVRWFGLDMAYRFGPKRKQLPRVGWVDVAEPGAIGFLDPQYVLRAAHLIPAFALGQCSDLILPTIARRKQDNDKDWERHYVSIFVDRDMFSRYIPGIAIGHSTYLPECHQVPHEEPEGQPLGEEELQDEEVSAVSGDGEDKENNSELDDYSYRDELDGEWVKEDVGSEEEGGVDTCTDILRAEGYAHL